MFGSGIYLFLVGNKIAIKKKSALKAGSVAGPKSPTRISAKHAAIPAAFLDEPELVSFYKCLTMKERDQVQIRIYIGKLSAALIEKDNKKVISVLDKFELNTSKDPRSASKKKAIESLKKRFQE
jgi:hypothetical protein